MRVSGDSLPFGRSYLHCAGHCSGNSRSSSGSGEDESWSIGDHNVDSSSTLDNSILLDEGADDHREVNDISCLEDIDSVSIRSWCTEVLLVLGSSLGGERLTPW